MQPIKKAIILFYFLYVTVVLTILPVTKSLLQDFIHVYKLYVHLKMRCYA